MTKVVVKNGKVDEALKHFKQKAGKNGLLQKVREKEYYTKPSERKKAKRAKNQKNR